MEVSYISPIQLFHLLVIGIARGPSLSELSYMGMLGIMDPPREGARPSVTTLQSTGVNVKMVTGDAQETACAIAQAVGLQVCIYEIVCS